MARFGPLPGRRRSGVHGLGVGYWELEDFRRFCFPCQSGGGINSREAWKISSLPHVPSCQACLHAAGRQKRPLPRSLLGRRKKQRVSDCFRGGMVYTKLSVSSPVPRVAEKDLFGSNRGGGGECTRHLPISAHATDNGATHEHRGQPLANLVWLTNCLKNSSCPAKKVISSVF